MYSAAAVLSEDAVSEGTFIRAGSYSPPRYALWGSSKLWVPLNVFGHGSTLGLTLSRHTWQPAQALRLSLTITGRDLATSPCHALQRPTAQPQSTIPSQVGQQLNRFQACSVTRILRHVPMHPDSCHATVHACTWQPKMPSAL